MYKEGEDKKIIVSNEFVDIFRNFNVVDKIEEMKLLSKRELYLLLTVCFDKHDEDQPTVIHNFLEFKDYIMEINDLFENNKTDNSILIELSEGGYIETDNIVDENGNGLPTPLTKEEIRDVRINIINGDNLK
jgi:hypothetical protein